MHPADFYTGIVADLYGPLKRYAPDPEPYAAFLREVGGRGLELGCGDGDPLIELRRRGLDVEGVDSSQDMLDRCLRRADEAGVDVTLHCRRMEALDLPHRYDAVFLAGPTFTLLADDATALASLRSIRAHLTEGGRALVPLAMPEPTPADEIGRPSVTTAADGSELRVTVVSQERDEEARTQLTVLRYERHGDGRSTVEDRSWLLHWYTRPGFETMAEVAGLKLVSATAADGSTAGPDSVDAAFLLQAV